MTDPALLPVLQKLVPQKDGEPYTVHRGAVVDAVNADGTVDLTMSGVTVPRVPVLGGAGVWVGGTVSVLAWQGALLVLGAPDRGYPFVGDDPAQVRRIRWDGIASVPADTTAQAGSWIGWTSGTSSAVAGSGSGIDTEGIFRAGRTGLNTGTTTTGRAQLQVGLPTSSGSTFIFPGDNFWFRAMARGPSSLSDATNRFNMSVGMSGDVDAAPPLSASVTELAGFIYQDNLSGGNWEFRHRDGGTIQQHNTGVPVATSTNYLLEFNIDPAGRLRAWIDGALVVDTTTQVPVNRTLSPVLAMCKVTGTAARSFQFSWIDLVWVPAQPWPSALG